MQNTLHEWIKSQLKTFFTVILVTGPAGAIAGAIVGYFFQKYFANFDNSRITNVIIEELQDEYRKTNGHRDIKLFTQNFPELSRCVEHISPQSFHFTTLLLHGESGSGKTVFVEDLRKREEAYLYPFGKIWNSFLSRIKGGSMSANTVILHILDHIQSKKKEGKGKFIIFLDQIEKYSKEITCFNELFNPSELKEKSEYNNIILVAATMNISYLKEGELGRFVYKQEITFKDEIFENVFKNRLLAHFFPDYNKNNDINAVVERIVKRVYQELINKIKFIEEAIQKLNNQSQEAEESNPFIEEYKRISKDLAAVVQNKFSFPQYYPTISLRALENCFERVENRNSEESLEELIVHEFSREIGIEELDHQFLTQLKKEKRHQSEKEDERSVLPPPDFSIFKKYSQKLLKYASLLSFILLIEKEEKNEKLYASIKEIFFTNSFDTFSCAK